MKKQHKHSDKKRLSWQLIRDYLSNDLSTGEMHDIEKSVMKDPFNADAFDGFEDYAPASIDNDISNIKSRLNRRSGFEPGKQQLNMGMLVKIAAIVVLIFVVSGTVIYLSQHSENIFPKKVAQENLPETENTLPFIPDTRTMEITDSLDLAKKSEMQEELESKKEAQTRAAQERRRREIEEARKPLPTLKQKDAVAVLDQTEENTLREDDLLAYDEEGAIEEEPEMTTGVLTGQNTYNRTTASFDSNQTTMMQTQSAAGKTMINNAANVPDDTKLKLSTEAEALSEVAVNNQDKKASESLFDSNDNKSLKTLANSGSILGANPDSSRIKLSAVAAKPPEGMSTYKGSIFRKIMEEEPDAIGEFEVLFTIDEKGELSDFEVTKSINRRTDRKIIREIKNKGNWAPAYLSGTPVSSKASILLIF